MLLNKMKEMGVSTRGKAYITTLADVGNRDNNSNTIDVKPEESVATATNTTATNTNTSTLRQPSQSGHIGIDIQSQMQTHMHLQSASVDVDIKTDESDKKTSEAEIEENKKSEFEFKDIWHQNNPFYDQLYGLKFPYLQDLHDRYKQEKNNYTAVAKEIYSEFIHEDAIHVCNISYLTRENITNFIQSIDDNLDLEQMNSPTEIEKYLLLFNGAICETWNLMNSVYNFRYRQHLKGSVALL